MYETLEAIKDTSAASTTCAPAGAQPVSGGQIASGRIASVDVLSVEIYDQVYHLRGVDLAYIEYLASMVDEKMRLVAAQGGTVDSLRVAVLSALNIADELSSLHQRHDQLLGSQQESQSTLRSRAESLAGMLDEVLEERRVS